MCLRNHQLKFCSCEIDGENLPENYWVLYRHSRKKDQIIIGEAILPYFHSPDFQLNQDFLLKRINEDDAFDFEPNFQKKDCLVVHLKNKKAEFPETDSYCFEFMRNKWTTAKYDFFDLNNHFDEKKSGELRLENSGLSKS